MPAAAPSAPVRKELSAPQKAMHKLGLVRDIDLALHLPLRYEDETRIVTLREARDGQVVQVEGTVTQQEITYRPRRQLLVTLDDGTDTCTLRFFSFYPAHQKTLAEGARVRVRGEVRGGFMGKTMMHPAFHAAGGELPDALTPVYPTSAQLPQAYLRKAVVSGLKRADLSETLPQPVLSSLQDTLRGLRAPLLSLRQALEYLHHPGPDVSLAALEDRSHPAWQRLKAEELLAQQLSQLTAKRERDALRAPTLTTQAGGLHEQLLAALPFALTAAQRRVGEEIAHDLQRQVPMHRLLQGDVGSGKTVVAALAAAIAMDSGWQCALMAPTEILAEQHFAKLIGWLEPLLAPLGKRVAWLTGSQKKKQRTEMLALIASGRGGAGGRHARRDPGPGAVQEPGAGHHRRAAPLRRGAAAGAALQDGGRRAGGGRASPAHDERDPDSPNPGHELLRRPERVHHRRIAAGSHAHRHQGGVRQSPPRGDRTHPCPGQRGAAGLLGLPADRGERGDRPVERPPRPTPNSARRSTAPKRLSGETCPCPRHPRVRLCRPKVALPLPAPKAR